MITVTILDDTVPEDEKTVVVRLTNPIGGANIANGTATIVILPNDNVAGVLALDKTSVLANEGIRQHHEKMALWALRPGSMQTVLYSHRRWLEA